MVSFFFPSLPRCYSTARDAEPKREKRESHMPLIVIDRGGGVNWERKYRARFFLLFLPYPPLFLSSDPRLSRAWPQERERERQGVCMMVVVVFVFFWSWSCFPSYLLGRTPRICMTPASEERFGKSHCFLFHANEKQGFKNYIHIICSFLRRGSVCCCYKSSPVILNLNLITQQLSYMPTFVCT